MNRVCGLITVARAAVVTTATVAATTAITATTIVTTAAAAATTIASATALAATEATTTTAAARSLALIGLFYHQRLLAQRYIVEVLNGIPPVLVVHHFYKGKAAAFTRFFIHGYFCRRNRTKFFENFYQLVVKQIVREAGYKKFHTES